MNSPRSNPIPLCDLRPQNEPLGEEIRAAMDEVIRANAFINGPQVRELERQVAEYCGTADAVGCTSGTDALLVSLMALGVGRGDEVITTPFTFFATVGSIARLGAKPVFVDIEPGSFNLNPALLERAITPRTRGIIPVHLFGQCAEMDPILEIAKKRNLFVLEDAAQAIGAEYHGRRACSMGIGGCLSFFPSKNLGCFGDGGMVASNDQKFIDKVRLLAAHGSPKRYYHSDLGANFRLDTLQAAVLLVKLKHLDRWTSERQEAAARYHDLIRASSAAQQIVRPKECAERRHVYNQFVIRTRERDRVAGLMQHDHVGHAIYYPLSLHLQECFQHLGGRPGDYPETERACNEVLALPMFPGISQEQQQQVVETLSVAVQPVRNAA